MKCNIILACLVCILSVELSYSKSIDNKAFSGVMSQIQENIKTLKIKASLSNPSDCTKTFMDNIKNLEVNFEIRAEPCMKNAAAQRKDNTQLNANYFNLSRFEIESYVKEIQKYFDDCSSQKDIHFFSCMAGKNDTSMESLNAIKVISESVVTNNSKELAAIDDAERTCLLDPVNKYKTGSEKMISEMESCLGKN